MEAQYTGPIGLLIVVLIGVATVLLILNMNKRIKRLPPSFPDRPAEQDGTDAARPASDDG